MGSREIDLREQWDDLSLEQQRLIINQSLVAVIVEPSGRGKRFNPDRLKPIFRTESSDARATRGTWTEDESQHGK